MDGMQILGEAVTQAEFLAEHVILQDLTGGSKTMRDMVAIQAQLRQMNPELSHEELVSRTRAAIMQLQNMHRCTKILFLRFMTFTNHIQDSNPSHCEPEHTKCGTAPDHGL